MYEIGQPRRSVRAYRETVFKSLSARTAKLPVGRRGKRIKGRVCVHDATQNLNPLGNHVVVHIEKSDEVTLCILGTRHPSMASQEICIYKHRLILCLCVHMCVYTYVFIPYTKEYVQGVMLYGGGVSDLY